VSRDSWPGTTTLVANIAVHTAQICALVWSPNGREFATGGDDDLCCLFDTEKVLNPSQPRPRCDSSATVRRHHQGPPEVTPGLSYAAVAPVEATAVGNGDTMWTTKTSADAVCRITLSQARHCWMHRAAIKAIAFCPWQDGLLATGGGSNDHCVHFFHTRTGTTLATINVGAQVTSLVWSTTRREIAVTFGYAQPEHSFRIAVYEWPSCEQVGAIHWEGGPRALCAVSYPSTRPVCRISTATAPLWWHRATK
jgi:WD40 repeat protein